MGTGLGPVAGSAQEKQQREGQTPHHEILPARRPLRSVLPLIPIRPPNPYQGPNTALHPAVWDRASSSDSLFVTAKRRDVAGHQERHTLHPRDIRVIRRLLDHEELDLPLTTLSPIRFSYRHRCGVTGRSDFESNSG